MADEKQSRLSAREVAAEYATGTVFDITECAREPFICWARCSHA